MGFLLCLASTEICPNTLQLRRQGQQPVTLALDLEKHDEPHIALTVNWRRQFWAPIGTLLIWMWNLFLGKIGYR
jgi:hypothetical protein